MKTPSLRRAALTRVAPRTIMAATHSDPARGRRMARRRFGLGMALLVVNLRIYSVDQAATRLQTPTGRAQPAADAAAQTLRSQPPDGAQAPCALARGARGESRRAPYLHLPSGARAEQDQPFGDRTARKSA